MKVDFKFVDTHMIPSGILIAMTVCGICLMTDVAKTTQIKCCTERRYFICDNCIDRVENLAAGPKCSMCDKILTAANIRPYSKFRSKKRSLNKYKYHILGTLLTLISIAVPYLHLIIGMGNGFEHYREIVYATIIGSGGVVLVDLLIYLFVYLKSYHSPYYNVTRYNILHFIKITITLLLAIPKLKFFILPEKAQAIIFVTLMLLALMTLTLYSVGVLIYSLVRNYRRDNAEDTIPTYDSFATEL